MSNVNSVEESIQSIKDKEREARHHYRQKNPMQNFVNPIVYDEQYRELIQAVQKQNMPSPPVCKPTKPKKSGGSGRFGQSVGSAILKEIKPSKSSVANWNSVGEPIEISTNDGKVVLQRGRSGEITSQVEYDQNNQPIHSNGSLTNELVAKQSHPKLDAPDNMNLQPILKMGMA